MNRSWYDTVVTKPYRDCIIHTVPPVFIRIIRGLHTGTVRYDTCPLPRDYLSSPGGRGYYTL